MPQEGRHARTFKRVTVPGIIDTDHRCLLESKDSSLPRVVNLCSFSGNGSLALCVQTLESAPIWILFAPMLNMNRTTQQLKTRTDDSARNVPVRAGHVLPHWAIGFMVAAFFPLIAYATDLRLAEALFEEGDWPACLIECRRAEATSPGLGEVKVLRAAVEAEQARCMRAKAWWKQVGAWPVKGLVGFYRFAIAPAIGSRCVLEPSCSRYSLEAARQYGWLSLPMTGDRLIREPSVVHAAAHPVTNALRQIRYADPVSDHMGWGKLKCRRD